MFASTIGFRSVIKKLRENILPIHIAMLIDKKERTLLHTYNALGV